MNKELMYQYVSKIKQSSIGISWGTKKNSREPHNSTIRKHFIGSLGAHNSEAYVSNVVVSKATLIGTTNGVRIKTWQGGHGMAKNIIFQDILMKNVTNPIIINQDYCDQTKACPEQKSAVQVSNVLYKNIHGTSSRPEAIKFECSKSIPCQGISMQNVKLVDDITKQDVSKASCSNVKLKTSGHHSSLCT
ncbi:BnaC03g35610D [Brassica napus]|uniref:BnaC03g35610D protein n=1 Tax=Brassica napus TaxID=3708 RepID=A0A078F4H1_BRANA|nr:BnaC03g35610D [Brassica napus]